jgi:ABC-type lipoprotein release transport system permease subunit
MSDDRGRILVGRGLADQMGITVGRRVSLAISNSDGQPQEGIFTVAGLFDTGFPGIDHNRVILPLEQAQTFSGVSDRVSSIILMLHNREDTANLAAKFTGPDTQVRTWEDLNAVMLESLEIGIVVYYLIYLIIFLVVAVLIANTLLMSVFARAREIGILASLGMKQRQIMSLFFLEGFMLALFGIAVGWVLGLGVVYYLANVGFSVPAETAAMAEEFTIGTTIYGGYAPGEFVILSLLLLAIVSLASLYPAWFAAKMEPVEALNTL